MTAPARLNLPLHGLKKPEIWLSPNGLRQEPCRPRRLPRFPAAAPIWGGI